MKKYPIGRFATDSDDSKKMMKFMSELGAPMPKKENFIYRGMFLTPEMLNSILEKGLDPKKSMGGAIYFTSNPEDAVLYSLPLQHVLEERLPGNSRFVSVVFQIDTSAVSSEKKAWLKSGPHFIYNYENFMPPEWIKAIYLLNPKFSETSSAFHQIKIH